MLEPKARKVLKYLISINKPIAFDNLYPRIKFKNKDNCETTKVALSYLLEENCVAKDGFNNNGTIYKLTNKGKMYFKTCIKEYILALLNGIIFPVIIALVTAIVTTLSTLYLSKLQSQQQSTEPQFEVECCCNNDNQANQ